MLNEHSLRKEAATLTEKTNIAINKIAKPETIAPKLRLKDGVMVGVVGSTQNEVDVNVNACLKACGTSDMDMMNVLISQLVLIMPPVFAKNESKVNGALAMLSGIAPKNELEGMLAVQMVSTHILSMETAKRSMLEEQSVEAVTDNINRSTKLMKTFTLQAEALSKLRGNTKTVTVKHVTVANGGQAIIGDVHQKGNSNEKN